MHFIRAVILGATFCAGAAFSQEMTPQSRVDIKTSYEADQASAALLPVILRQAIFIAEDKHIYERSLFRSPVLSYFSLTMTDTKQTGINLELLFGRLWFQVRVALALTKDEFLNWYAQKVYLGLNCFGVEDAAMAYFGKSVDELTLEDAALLAALPRAPSQYNPERNADRAIERRNFIIDEMLEAGLIASAQAEQASETDIALRSLLVPCQN